MNRLMSFILLSYSAGFIILCVDALTSNMVINKNKFAMDVLIANTNVCTVYLLIILISIFHPRPQYASHGQSEISSNNGSNIQNSINSIGNDKSFARPVASAYSLNNAVSSSFPSQKQQPLNMAIEDPYSNKTIMFSMMSAPLQTQVGLATSGIKVDASGSQKWDPQEEKNIYTQNQSISSHRLSLETNNSYNVSTSSEAHLNHQRGNVAPDWFWGSADRRDP
ncbi:hypothetical protein G6F37_010751 [Rhizopus arrhizus]|nr:hypothetical protein G6F37_010751 [Rhizopus arrhizus]